MERPLPTLNISLTVELASFVEREIASGYYATVSEVVQDALQVLIREQELESEKLAALKAAVAEGLADAEAGRFSDRSVEELAAEVLARTQAIVTPPSATTT